MITVANRIPVNPEYASDFEERFAQRGKEVDTMPGFISFQLLRPSKEGDPYVVLTHWESEEHFRAWTSSDAFTKEHAKSSTLPREAFLGHPNIEVHEVIQQNVKQPNPEA